MSKLEPPVAIVTGAAGAIGRAVVERFVAGGHVVVAADVAWEGVAPAGVSRVAVDVTDGDERRSLVAYATRCGPVRALVNAAGVLGAAPVDAVTSDLFVQLVTVNAMAPFFLAREVIREMGAGSAIVNVASSAAKLGSTAELVPYAASKAALLSITRSLALLHAENGIRVNAVCPGIVASPMQESLADAIAQATGRDRASVLAARVRSVPMGRAARADEVAEVVWFLASPAASYMTGQAINVTGGQVTW